MPELRYLVPCAKKKIILAGQCPLTVDVVVGVACDRRAAFLGIEWIVSIPDLEILGGVHGHEAELSFGAPIAAAVVVAVVVAIFVSVLLDLVAVVVAVVVHLIVRSLTALAAQLSSLGVLVSLSTLR